MLRHKWEEWCRDNQECILHLRERNWELRYFGERTGHVKAFFGGQEVWRMGYIQELRSFWWGWKAGTREP
jgi:hypothetical protein